VPRTLAIQSNDDESLLLCKHFLTFLCFPSPPMDAIRLQAGLAPTLVMGVPNTVLYFYSYDELSGRLRKRFPEEPAIPAIAGASARFVASLSTAPLELLRTRQAARIGAAPHGPGIAEAAAAEKGTGMLSEFRTMIRIGGVPSLYRGVWPTLLRDVPFSAVYWLSIERMRGLWRSRRQDASSSSAPSAWAQAIQAFINGSVSGMMAAAVTTPLDVLKTRSQVIVVPSEYGQVARNAAAAAELAMASAHRIGGAAAAVCDHAGATLAYPKPSASLYAAIGGGGSSPRGVGASAAAETAATPQSTIAMARSIVEAEGVSGLWRGNTARMLKVAPACGIMISSYEIGKRLLNDDSR
jgi:solute carrier family 25, member 39/40